MHLPIHIEKAYLRLVDFVFEHLPQPMPSAEKLKQCKIISHRGEHDTDSSHENTLAAFEKAARANVWGIELDVHWTRDWIPVVAHDADMSRLFGKGDQIAQKSLAELNARFPTIPTLQEVISRFGQRLHLMIEIKQQSWTHRLRQGDILADVLSPLRPETDYHLLSLTPRTLIDLPLIPPGAKVPIAYYLPDRFSRLAIQHQWGGLCGHYLIMRCAIISRHKKRGQQVGTGYADSVNTLLRELNRGIHWIFSNKAARMQAFVNARQNHYENINHAKSQ